MYDGVNVQPVPLPVQGSATSLEVVSSLLNDAVESVEVGSFTGATSVSLCKRHCDRNHSGTAELRCIAVDIVGAFMHHLSNAAFGDSIGSASECHSL